MRIDPRVWIWTGIVLVAVNVLLFNLLLDGIGGLRVDVTEGRSFSLSPVTERLITDLDEQAKVHAIFSRTENLPEQLRPFLPRIRDLLLEYEARSEGGIDVIFSSPDDDEEAARMAQDRFGIQPQAFAYSEQNQRGVKSFTFGIAIEYAGSRPETITLPDLIERANVFGDRPELRLRNVEFAISRALKRAVFGFENQRGVFARFEGTARLKTWISPAEDLPEEYAETPERVREVFAELAEESGGKLVFEPQEVPEGEEAQVALARREGVRSFLFPFQDEPVYLWAAVEIDGRNEALLDLVGSGGTPGAYALRTRVEDVFKKRTPGFLPTVGIVQETPPPPNPMMGNQPQQRSPYSALQAEIALDHEVRSLDPLQLAEVPAGIDVLVVTGREELGEDAVYAIDQYVMRGGKAIFLVDRCTAELVPPMTLRTTTSRSGLEDLLASWGVELAEGAVVDPVHAGDFFWTVGGDAPGRQAAAADFRWGALPFVGESDASVNRDVPFLGAFDVARFWFPTHLVLRDVEGITGTWLLRTSSETWTARPETLAEPRPRAYPKVGYAAPEDAERSSRILAALVQGRLRSYWADRAVPAARAAEAASGAGEATTRPADEKVASAPLKEVADGRVIVIANDDFVDDIQAGITRQLGPPFGVFVPNARVVLDMIDWLLEDDELIAIRNRGRTHRPLERLEPDEVRGIQALNFAGPLAGLLVLAIVVAIAQRLRRPVTASAGAKKGARP